MKVKYFTHENVDKKGRFKMGTVVSLKPNVKLYKDNPCYCSGICNNEHNVIVISKGRNPFTKQVKGTTLYFESTAKLESYVDELETIEDLLYFE